MKKVGATILSALLAVMLIAGGLQLTSVFAQTPGQQAGDEVTQRTIHVTGTGIATTQPDTAVVVIGVQTENAEASAALSQNSQQMDSLINVLQQAGVAQEDIKTTNINLSPRYDNKPSQTGQPEVTGYIAMNTVQARIRGVSEVGSILDAAVQEGGNVIQSIYFEVSDPAQAQQQARQDAFNDARQKAQDLADLAGVQIGRLVSVSETTSPGPIPYGFGGRDVAVEQAVPVQPGTQNIQVNLDVTWEITGGQAFSAEGTGTAVVPLTGIVTRTPTAEGTATRAATPTPAVEVTSTPIAKATEVDSIGNSAADLLRSEGASVQLRGTIQQPFFPVVGRVLDVNGEEVQAFTFQNAADAQRTADTIAQGESQIRTLAANLLGEVHFFHEGDTIVLYNGSDQDTIDLLTRAFGSSLGALP